MVSLPPQAEGRVAIHGMITKLGFGLVGQVHYFNKYNTHTSNFPTPR